MPEYRSIEGELKVLERKGEFIFPVELWLLNDQTNRNNWRFVDLEGHRAQWAGVPILVAYVNGGRTVGDGHNQEQKMDQNGEVYQSFTDATAERIVGALSDDPDDIRIEERDGASWVVGRGFLWAWYAHELCLQIADDAVQGRAMSVSIEALVTESYMDGNVEVETSYKPLGVTVLGRGVAPAVPDAHIAMLTEMESEFKELKLRAASYLEQDNADKPQNDPEKKGMIRRMRLSKQQVRELQAKFGDHNVLFAEQDDNGVIVGLMANDGQTAIYRMASLDESVVIDRIESCPVQARFCAEGCEEVYFDACEMIEPVNAANASLTARLASAETSLTEANEKIEKMVNAENARRLSAAKAKAEATLSAFNANREQKIEEKVLEALNAEIEAGKFTACADENGAWTGEKIVEEKVLSLCATVVMEQDKQNAAHTEPMTWGGFKAASAAPGTIGELFAKH